MKTRLGIFVVSLLLLPMAGFWLSGADWPNEFAAGTTPEPKHFAATLFTSFALLGFILLINHITRLRTGSSPLNVQSKYFLMMGVASAVLGWLLAYLNHFAANWSSEPGDPVLSLLFYTPLFALLAPAVLSTRALLGSFAGLLKRLARGMLLPAPGGETLVFIIMLIAALGLLGGAVWPQQLFWLLWLAPLLLLVGLQLLWHQGTIFSGLKSGDWGRVVCVVLAGMITCNFAMLSYRMSGGSLEINLPHPLLAQLGYAVFGLLCQQLGDVIAEQWRGVRRGNLFRQKKKFPISVVVKKS